MDISQQLDQNLALPVKPVLYNTDNRDSQLKQLQRITFLNSSRRGRRVGTKSTQLTLDTEMTINTDFIPRLPAKHLADAPKFLFSLERKKLRIRNGIETRSHMGSRMQRKQFHSEKPRRSTKQQPERCRHTNTIHTAKSPEWCIIPPVILKQKAEVPHFLFNIHHMSSNKPQEFSLEELQRRTAKGANTMYYGCSTSHRTRHTTAQSSRSFMSTTQRSGFREFVLPQ